MNTRSFRVRWGLGILILVGAFVASQSIYHTSIARLHDHLLNAARITEEIHTSEQFHSALHLMLIIADGYAETGNDGLRTDFAREREVARATLATLSQRHPPPMFRPWKAISNATARSSTA